MMQAFFNGLSGMITFGRGLDNISNNISNMNTAGYHGVDLFYNALGNDGGQYSGARISGSAISSNSGSLRETSNPTDLAISGNGYFILRTPDGPLYTRAGQFRFDADGYLTDTNSGYRVAALDSHGNLTDINIQGLMSLNPVTTDKVTFTGNLSTGDTDHSVQQMKVFNSLGEEISLDLNFTNNTSNTPGSWMVSVKDKNGIEVATGEVRFAADGSPLTGYNQLSITLPASANGSANTPMTFSLDFGTEGSFDGATSFSGGTVSSLSVGNINGQGQEGLVAISFKEDGQLNLLYSNGENKTPFQLAIATFQDEQGLSYVDGSLLRYEGKGQTHINHANDNGAGKIKGKNLESSNVDLVREFAEMIIIQRGYQASSRVMTISNQLVQRLYDSARR